MNPREYLLDDIPLIKSYFWPVDEVASDELIFTDRVQFKTLRKNKLESTPLVIWVPQSEP